MVPGSSFSMDEFASKAILAGFDYVKYASENYLEVCVKLQDGMQATVVSFPLAKLIAVPLPVGEEDEYDYPEVVKKETRKPLLFDFFTSPDIIGIHFRLSNFVSPGRRHLRIDPVLVNLLDLGYNIYHGGFYVISGSGYRPRSVNNDNIATRHEKEIIRYRMGQAVEIKPNMPTNNDMLFDLGLAMIKVARTVRMRRIGVGIGCKTDRLYFEIRPMNKNNSKSIDVWESGNVDLFNRLKEIEYLVSIGNFRYFVL